MIISDQAVLLNADMYCKFYSTSHDVTNALKNSQNRCRGYAVEKLDTVNCIALYIMHVVMK